MPPRTLRWRGWATDGADVGQRLAVEVVGEDRLDRPVGVRRQRERPGTGRLAALGAVAVGQADDAERGAIALLGVAAALQDARDQGGGRRAGLLGPGHDARRRPLGVAAVGLGHVGGVGGVRVADEAAHVRGHASD